MTRYFTNKLGDTRGYMKDFTKALPGRVMKWLIGAGGVLLQRTPSEGVVADGKVVVRARSRERPIGHITGSKGDPRYVRGWGGSYPRGVEEEKLGSPVFIWVGSNSLGVDQEA
eukprot:766438-Hanusia_phi.AAC.5